MNKGTSQETRKSKALSADYIALDERSMLDMMQFTLDFSENINFYDYQKNRVDSWKPFLLNDSAFVIAMIAATDLNEFKIADNSPEYQAKSTNNEDDINSLKKNIFNTIKQWQLFLTRSNYKGILINEIDKLIDSVENKNPKTKSSEETGPLKETYENIYGNIVYIKEIATIKFNKEILSSQHHPHVGLLIAFFRLFKNLKKDTNAITKKHLDYYYKDLLQQQRKKPNSGSAIIAVKIQPGNEELTINEDDKFEFIYTENQKYIFKASSQTEINRAEIAEIKTLYKSDYYPFSSKFSEDDFSINILYEENILKEESKHLKLYQLNAYPSILGEEQLHSNSVKSNTKLSDIGFLISSPALILEHGKQEIKLIFKISTSSLASTISMINGLVNEKIKQKKYQLTYYDNIKNRIISDFFKEAFLVFITDNKGWKQVKFSNAKINEADSALLFDINLEEKTDSLFPYNKEIHEGGFESDWPCIKLILNNDVQYYPYKFLQNIVVEEISIQANVTEAGNLTLTNSFGNLDSSIPVTPFGPTPVKGSYLKIQNPRILQKNLSSLQLNLNWIGLPYSRTGFAEYYREYPGEMDNSTFKATLSQTRNTRNTEKQLLQTEELFVKENVLSDVIEIDVKLTNLKYNNSINASNTTIDENTDALFLVLSAPEIAFGHQLFSELYAAAALKSSRFKKIPVSLPKQPYTPLIENLTVNYTNTAREVVLRKQDEKGSDIKFVHIYPFGHIPIYPGPIKSECFLLPQINYKGNLLIGLKNIKPGNIVSIGFELIPTVYIHTVLKAPKIKWAYLINNEWISTPELILEDSTDGLTRSGIVKIEMPKTIQLENTRLPQGKFWLKAISEGKEDLNSRIKNIFTQAVSLVSDGSESNLLPGLNSDKKIQKISFEGKKGIDSIIGPFALGLMESGRNEDNFYTRTSELLRHKNRAVSNWDVERIILDKYKQIDKVRVYGRSSHPNELVKGSNLQIVLIPKNLIVDGTRNLSTNVDFSTLKEVKNYISTFLSPFVKVEVSNPVYEWLKVRCSIKFRNAQKGGYFRNVLNNELISFLSPDIENEFIKKGFGESISKTDILNFIESRSYVEFVTGFSVLQLVEVQGNYKIIDTAIIDAKDDTKIESLRTISAYAILTSAPEHQIIILQDELMSPPQKSGISDLSIESDFVISDDEGNYY